MTPSPTAIDDEEDVPRSTNRVLAVVVVEPWACPSDSSPPKLRLRFTNFFSLPQPSPPLLPFFLENDEAEAAEEAEAAAAAAAAAWAFVVDEEEEECEEADCEEECAFATNRAAVTESLCSNVPINPEQFSRASDFKVGISARAWHRHGVLSLRSLKRRK
jgi:hypothetical protein